MNNNRLLATAVAGVIGLTSTLAVQADTIGFRVGGYSWSQNYDGEIRSSSSAVDEISLNDDLGFDDETGSTIYAVLEHPIPIIPNIMIQQTDLEISATSNLSRSFAFEGETYSANQQLSTTSDLSHTDATLYYEILDNWVSIDVGLTVRKFTEGFELVTDDATSVLDIDSAIPLIYLAAKVELPLTGLYIGAELNAISVGDASLTDIKASIGYETDFGLGIEAGFRQFELDYDDDDEQANITVDGGFIGIFYHF